MERVLDGLTQTATDRDVRTDITHNDQSVAETDTVSMGDVLRHQAIIRADQRVYTFLHDGESISDHLTFAEMDLKVRAIAAHIQSYAQPGDRILMLYPPGLEYLCAFMACLYADVVAIPAYPPRNKRHVPRFQSILSDSRAALILTTTEIIESMEKLFMQVPEMAGLRWLTTDDVATSLSSQWQDPHVTADRLAFLQYTSGSTSAPKGVMLTQGNLVQNQKLIQTACEHTSHTDYVSWLPLFHDMGLGNALQTIYIGSHCVLMPPVSFVQKPIRWLKAISDYKAHTSGGPNFGYEFCLKKIDREACEGLDLSHWKVAFNGAEPVRHGTLQAFNEKFSPYGFDAHAWNPCYGLAEATVAVTGNSKRSLPMTLSVDGEALGMNKVQLVDSKHMAAQPLVSSGRSWLKQKVLVVDPESCQPVSTDEVGEIWIQSPSVGVGYWNRRKETEETFNGRLKEDEGPFLRSGDLGFIHNEHLYVTGRQKDLIIIRGRNYYPQDVEKTVEQAYQKKSEVSLIREDNSAAFAIELEGQERLVVVAEVERRYQLVCQRQARKAAQSCQVQQARQSQPDEDTPDPWEVDPDQVVDQIRQAVSEIHDLHVHAILLLKMGGMPRTSSGKIQRHQCRQRFLNGDLPTVWISELSTPEVCVTVDQEQAYSSQKENSSAEFTQDALLRLTAEEQSPWLVQQLRQQISQALGVPLAELPADKPLYVCGLDSLMAVELGHRVESAFSLHLSEMDVLDGLTIALLTEKILAHVSQKDSSTDCQLETLPDRVESPLSQGQRAMWFLHELSSQNRAYNLGFAAKLPVTIDMPTLQKSFQWLLNRHPALRSVYPSKEGEPILRVLPDSVLDVLHQDASGWSASQLTQAIDAFSLADFDLANGPLMRLAHFSGLSDGAHVLVVNIHHIAIDQWSLLLMLDELDHCYRAVLTDQAPTLAELTFSYSDYVYWQSQMLASPEGDRLLAYWKQELEGCEGVLELPADHSRPSVQSYTGAAYAFQVDDKLTGQLRELAKENSATLYMLLLASFQLLLFRYTRHSRQRDILVGSPAAGRNRAGLENLVGYFVDPIVLRARFSDDLSFKELLAAVRETVFQALKHQHYPFSLLVEKLKIPRDPTRSPLFQSMFVLQRAFTDSEEDISGFMLGQAGGKLSLGDSVLESLPLTHRVAMFDLTLTVAEGRDCLNASLEYNSELFEAGTIVMMASHFQTLLRSIVADSHASVSALSLLTTEDIHHLTEDINETETSYPLACVHQLVEDQAQQRPDQIAVRFNGATLTYGMLNKQANQLAFYLREQGVEANSPVGICQERGFEMIVSVLAVLKAGGAYVALDPAYPIDRLRYMIQDAGVEWLLMEERLADCLPEVQAKRIFIEKDWVNIGLYPQDNPPPLATVNDLAYLLYTSGSTGEPKGVMMPHSVLNNLICWQNSWQWHEYQVSAGDRTLQFSSLNFDVSFQEIFSTLAAGGELLMIDDVLRQEPASLLRFIAEEQVNRLFLPYVALSQLSEVASALAIYPASLREVITAGEQLLVSAPVKSFFQHIPQCSLINQYGPSETHVVSAYPLAGNPDEWEKLPPIGRPIANARIYLLDEEQKPVPMGVPGELVIGGAVLAQGYLNQKVQTAEKFLPDCFSSQEGARLYRSGDLARFLPAGNIEFLGRIDNQVKVRGYRVELGEIEVQLSHHSRVRDAVVIVREDQPGDKRITAYVLSDDQQDPLTDNELLTDLQDHLPDYMLPSAFVILNAFPMTPSGKVDRRALPRPDGRKDYAERYVAPNTPTQLAMARIWEEVLNVERISTAADFFRCGGHSLLATQMVARVHAFFHVELVVRSVFEHPTIVSLSAVVDELISHQESQTGLPLQRLDRGTSLLASFSQQRLWFMDKINPHSAVYNIPCAIRLSGSLDVPVLERSLTQIILRHEALRTRFISEGDHLLQRIDDAAVVELEVISLMAVAEDERESRMMTFAESEACKPFNLTEGPLFRQQLLKLGNEDHVVLLNMHHSISDGWSLGILSREISVLYTAYLKKEPSPLHELPLQYADYAYWQRQWLVGEVFQTQLAYWKEQLDNGDVPLLEFPADFPRPRVQTYNGAHETRHLPLELSLKLEELSHRENASLCMTLLSAFNVLMYRYSGQEDVSLGFPLANRKRVETESMIGFFVNTVVMRNSLTGDPDFRDFLARVKEVSFGAFNHQDLPFEQVVEALDITRDTSRNPLFQVMFTLQNAPLDDVNLPNIRAQVIPLDNHTAKFDLWISLWERRDGIACSMEYNTDLFRQDTVVRLLQHFEHLLQNIVENPALPISRYRLCPQEEYQKIVTTWNDTNVGYADQCVHQLFVQQAKASPDAIAVSCGEQVLSYCQLNQQSNQLAHYLLNLGIERGSKIGVCLPRSVNILVAILAVLKSGNCYVPMDPTYPASRLKHIVSDTNMPILLTHHSLQSMLPDTTACPVCVEQTGAQWQGLSIEEPAVEYVLDSPVYMIYTSGSTGLPKGTIIHHRGLINLLEWYIKTLGIQALDSTLIISSPGFDLTQKNLLSPLLCGAKVVFPVADFYDVKQFCQIIAEQQISWLNCAPSAFYPLVDLPAGEENTEQRFQQLTSLRALVLGGEPIVVNNMLGWIDSSHCQTVLFNSYGPTECSDIASCYRIDNPLDFLQLPIPIGKPIQNVQLRVLTADTQVVPIGVVGELCIGGVGVGPGYYQQEDLTRDRFIPDPFNKSIPSARLYRTGDLGRLRADGEIVYMGRRDHQVKIRGNRIELGEIESVLKQHPAIQDAVTIAREDRLGDQRLVTYLVSCFSVERVRLNTPCLVKVGDQQAIPLRAEDIASSSMRLGGLNDHWADGTEIKLMLSELVADLWIDGQVVWSDGQSAGVQFKLALAERSLIQKGIENVTESESFSVLDLRRFTISDPRRADFRVPLSIPVSTTLASGRHYDMHSEDLSAGSVRLVNVPTEWQANAPVNLSLKLPDMGWTDFTAEVIWQEGKRAALRFTGNETQQSVLHRCVMQVTHEEGLWISQNSLSNLRDYLKKRLPDFMLPSAFVLMDELPVSPNGKIDRKALPVPDYSVEAASNQVLPRTSLETQLAASWCEVLSLESTGVFDNFFEQGGHSLLATQLLSRVRDQFQVEPSLTDFFNEPTIACLGKLIADLQDKQKSGEITVAPSIQPIARRKRKSRKLADKIGQLSESEVAELLKKKREALSN